MMTARPLPMAAEQDADDVRRALSGDERGWAALVARYDHKVVVSLLARGVPLDRARELAQETWLRLIERQRAGRLPALVLPGLAIVQAGFLAADERRRPREESLDAIPDAPAGAGEERRLFDREQLQRVRVALEACPPGARRVFELVYAHPELSYAEVAARFGLSTQRVKQIVCEVRKRLRDAIEENE